MTDQSELRQDELLGLADIATILGLSAASVRTYHTDATRRRRADESLPQDMPAPDVTIGRTPAWERRTVLAWQDARRAASERNLERLRQPRGTRVDA
uniref:DNA binding protein n=1 Tax=Microbacterium phage Merry TaxID=3144827 RepID=A0AAU7J8G6_9VIRU